MWYVRTLNLYINSENIKSCLLSSPIWWARARAHKLDQIFSVVHKLTSRLMSFFIFIFIRLFLLIILNKLIKNN